MKRFELSTVSKDWVAIAERRATLVLKFWTSFAERRATLNPTSFRILLWPIYLILPMMYVRCWRPSVPPASMNCFNLSRTICDWRDRCDEAEQLEKVGVDWLDDDWEKESAPF